MNIAILKETDPDETRVAIVPESVKRLVKKGFAFTVESGAGEKSSYSNEDYVKAGATIESDRSRIFASSDLLMKINLPTSEEVAEYREGTSLISFVFPMLNTECVQLLASKKISVFGLDCIPRTTLAQAMDVLSSQSTVAGYKAVLMGASHLPKFFPMLMTASGTIPPAKVLVLGAGVAGLQACATAKRLGAIVEAFDVRSAAKEQVESLGVKFIEVPVEEDASTAGGYAKEMSEAYKKKQGELVHKHVAKADLCITTALIPGKPAPKLITEQMVKDMKSGSVIVDLAAVQGGNCELTEPGQNPVKYGVTIMGHKNIPATVPFHASLMFSKNIEKFLLHLSDDGNFTYNMEDEITAGSLVTRNGDIIHAQTKELVG